MFWPKETRRKVVGGGGSFYWRAMPHQEGQVALSTSGGELLDPWDDGPASPVSGGLAHRSYENPQAGGHGQSCPGQGRKSCCPGENSLLPMSVGHGQPRKAAQEAGGGGARMQGASGAVTSSQQEQLEEMTQVPLKRTAQSSPSPGPQTCPTAPVRSDWPHTPSLRAQP